MRLCGIKPKAGPKPNAKRKKFLEGMEISPKGDNAHIYGGFHKWGYPQIIQVSRILLYSIISHPFWGTLNFRKLPYAYIP